jgi:hypothetical protein
MRRCIRKQLQSGQLIKHGTRLIIIPTANNDAFIRSAQLPFESAETKAQREWAAIVATITEMVRFAARGPRATGTELF